MELYDIIVVGGGPAGLTAALYALRSGKRVLVLEKAGFGGQIALSPRLENFPGTPAMSGAEFSDRLLNQVTDLGGEIDLAEVTGLEDLGGEKLVHSAYGDYHTKAVILATGARHRMLGLPQEEELVGNGISYCAVCDGAFFRGKPVAVVGGGDAALQDALLLSGTSSEVYLIHRREQFRAEHAHVEAARQKDNIHFVLNSRVTRLMGSQALQAVQVESSDGQSRTLEVDGLFVAVGFEPENQPFSAVAALSPDGWFAAGEDCRTATAGVFVAGDCRFKSVRQVTTAVSDGAVAALAACRYLDALA